jgi:hypothetical protein
LCIGQKYDHEHDTKSEDVLRTTGQRRGQLCHRFVERNVFEDLHTHTKGSFEQTIVEVRTLIQARKMANATTLLN